MANYNEEKGSFILPAAAVASFRRGLVQAVNKEKELAFEAAQALHQYLTQPVDKRDGKPARRDRLTALNKALRKGYYVAEQILDDAFKALDPEGRGRWQIESSRKWNDEVREQAISLILPHNHGKPMKLQAPKKKDLNLLPSNATSFGNIWVGITIDPKSREVTWVVERNNHFVESARSSALGRAFFRELGKVKWTRNTGGHIRYKDEYAEDAAMDGHGDAVSTVNHMGPLGEKQLEHEWGTPLTRARRNTREI